MPVVRITPPTPSIEVNVSDSARTNNTFDYILQESGSYILQESGFKLAK